MTKRGKELKMNLSDNYNIVAGTVDSKKPKSIYINISAWGEPLLEGDLNYKRIISGLSKNMKQTLYNRIKSDLREYLVHNRTIVDLDMRDSGVQYGKRSFMNCEITLFQTGELPIHESPIVGVIENLIKEILENVLDSSPHFGFYKKKN